MRRNFTHKRSWVLVVSFLSLNFLMTGIVFGQESLRLPRDFPFAQGEGSPGKVTFRHGATSM